MIFFVGIRAIGRNLNLRKKTYVRDYRYILPFKAFEPFHDYDHYLKPKTEAEANNTLDQDQVLSRLHGLAKRFSGSKSYHNYTRRGKYKKEQQHIRYLKSIEVSKVQTNLPLQQDYLELRFVGASFVYNQIRKMVGCLLQAWHTKPTKGVEFIDHSLQPGNKASVWLAPAKGLYLHDVNFYYWAAKENDEHSYKSLEVSRLEEKRIEDFFESAIFTELLDEDDLVFADWLESRVNYKEGYFRQGSD